MRETTANDLRATAPSTGIPARGRWGVTRMRLRRPSGLLMWTTAAIALIALVVLGGFDGKSYYSTPLDVRGYTPTHAQLRPSGSVGIVLGIAGLALMLMPLVYVARKKIRLLSKWGSIQTWLQAHIFCGIVGPVLITFHTSFKFNGIIAVAFWLMVLVVLSGFVGRYLYVRIPRSVRGVELSHDEVRTRAEVLKAQLAASGLPTPLLEDVYAFERRAVPHDDRASLAGLFLGDLLLQRHRTQLRRKVLDAGIPASVIDDALATLTERAWLLRDLAYLRLSQRLFGMWHVFHLPLVYGMYAIAALHVGVALYFGYGIL
jgi:hypothetical protein